MIFFKTIFSSYSQIAISDPSVEGDTPFKSCRSEYQIFCQEISDEPNSRVIDDIKQQLRYDTWREIEEIMMIRNELKNEPKDKLNNINVMLSNFSNMENTEPLNFNLNFFPTIQNYNQV